MGYQCPSAYNPADFLIKTLAVVPDWEENCRQTIKKICDHFAVSDFAKEVEIVIQYEFHKGENEEVAFTAPLWLDIHINFLAFRWERALQ